MSSKYSFKKIDWVNTLFLTLTPVAAITFISLHLVYENFSWSALLIAYIFYLATGFSITAGYHRLFSHRSYKGNRYVKLFFLIFGAATFQNSLLKWASDHRKHHSKVDTPVDPYNINEGFFYAHMGWVMLKKEDEIEGVNDLKNDPLVMWQHNNYLAIAVVAGIIFPAFLASLFGSWYAGLGLAAFGRVVFVHHVTFFINSLCHYWGKQTYSDTHTAKDSALMALLTYGEGYHNFHHEFQIDYRNGVKWYHFDPTKWLINILKFLGMAWDLKTVSDCEILKAELLMKEKKLTHYDDKFRLRDLRERVEIAMRALEQLKKEYRSRSFNKSFSKEIWLREFNSKKEEFKAALKQWNQLYGELSLLAG